MSDTTATLKLKEDDFQQICGHINLLSQLNVQFNEMKARLAYERQALRTAWRAAYLEYLLEHGKELTAIPEFLRSDGTQNIRLSPDGVASWVEEEAI